MLLGWRLQEIDDKVNMLAGEGFMPNQRSLQRNRYLMSQTSSPAAKSPGQQEVSDVQLSPSTPPPPAQNGPIAQMSRTLPSTLHRRRPQLHSQRLWIGTAMTFSMSPALRKNIRQSRISGFLCARHQHRNGWCDIGTARTVRLTRTGQNCNAGASRERHRKP